jgi:hypothetical protein
MTPLEKSQHGLTFLKQAVVEYLQQYPEGLSNVEIARGLDLESDFEGGQKNYLSWSILGLLLREEAVHYKKQGNTRRYFAGPAEYLQESGQRRDSR